MISSEIEATSKKSRSVRSEQGISCQGKEGEGNEILPSTREGKIMTSPPVIIAAVSTRVLIVGRIRCISNSSPFQTRIGTGFDTDEQPPMCQISKEENFA
ncbi:hypothetical protein CEXT_809921 [Caerostris extrusa]|uniref:Uncharacterized protein n=1 Tax=Caerostris extrusa TaxID=172846 RepID=A0AAV4XA40_CAEEX|nr:hypothetical protein CEXT_809921 [Caerostris extrusa]